MLSFDIATRLRAHRRTVLAHSFSMDGVNRELAPFIRMTVPSAMRDRTIDEAPIGAPLFRSWLLLGGVVPFDFDHLVLESVDRESGFQEASTMLTMARWRHERRVRDAGTGCELEDRVELEPRIAAAGPAFVVIARRLFEHRHRRLAEIFGTRV